MKSNKTREKILDASLKLFNEKKASNVSTVQISAAMKISPGNLYYYYANKEEVIRCIWKERMQPEMDELLSGCGEVKTASDLLDYMEASMNYIVKYKFFYTEINTLFINDSSLVDLYKESEVQMNDLLSALYKNWSDNGNAVVLSDDSMQIMIKNCNALCYQIIASYEIAELKGNSFGDFLGIAWLHMISFLKPYFTEQMKKDVEAEMEKRGVSEKLYTQMRSNLS